MSVPDNPDLRLTNQFTIAFWLNQVAGASGTSLVSKGANTRRNGFLLSTSGSASQIYISLFNNGVNTARCNSNPIGPAQIWQHVAITFDGSTFTYYINGVVNASCAVAASAGTGVDPVVIGGVNGTNPSGTMDELRIYQRALSAQEITSVVTDTGLPPVVSVTVAVNPSTASLAANQTQSFGATVVGNTNTAVTWSVSPAMGTVSPTGIYTAPAFIGVQQTVSVIATSVADTTKSGRASSTLTTGTVLSAFQLPEFFGVSWPDQPIEFRYDGGQPPVATTRMIGPNGSEVPYQWVSSCSDITAVNGCIAVHSPLPANSSYTWTLQGGIAPAATAVNPATLTQVGSNLQITNGLTGVRIVTAAGNPGLRNLAPIQGILMPNGVWTGSGASPNLLYSESSGFAGTIGVALTTPMYTATGYTVTVTDSGPLKVSVTATYTFNRPKYLYGTTVINPVAGPGHYTVILTMYANSKSILVDEDSDMQFSYYLPLEAQLNPDQARYRGHDALDILGVSDPLCGYEGSVPLTNATNSDPIVVSAAAFPVMTNGQAVSILGVTGNSAANGFYYAETSGYATGQFGLFHDAALTQPVAGTGAFRSGGTVRPAYRGQYLYPTSDAYEDLTFSNDRPAAYFCSATSANSGYRKLLTDYPSPAHSAGWYTELYQSTGGAAAPVVGFYVGRASKQLESAAGPSQPGIYTSNRHWITGAQAAGIQVDNLLRGPSGTIAPLVHRNWGIFVSTQADLLAPASHQPIADEQNSLAGINLSRLYTYQLVYPDPPGGWQWEYLSTPGANKLISEVQNGTSVCGSPTCYYSLLKNSEGSPQGNALLTMWQGNNAAAVQTALSTALQFAQTLVTTLANGDNHFDTAFGYYQLGLNTSPDTAVLNAIIMNVNTTPAQKTFAKATLALFGCLFWDNDWFPIDNETGEGDGLANQIQQYLQYRTQSVAADPSQPFLASLLQTALNYPPNDLDSYFSPTGAVPGSTHYQSAFFEPLILNYLNFALDGDGSGALSMSDPRWAAYAKWELSIQTPPEPRFGGTTNPALGIPLRKGYSNGDGNTEADVRPGMLGTALYSVNPALASNLMWAWQQSNSATIVTEDSQFVTTLATIDPSIPAVAPQLASTNIPGYHSVERHNFGTPNETALWFINGGFYSAGGHRHADDGQVSIYAHAAPLAIDWNANLYSPETPGRFVHDSVVLDTELTHLWSADNAGLGDANTPLQSPTNTEFAAFANSTTSTGTFTEQDGTVWTRTVRTMDFDPTYPVIYVNDTFAGPSAIAGKTLTWNLMATGAVSTPAGPVTPTVRLSAGCQSPAGQLPSNGTVSPLASGLNPFNFTGFTWPNHATQGINWDLYLVPTTATQQFFIGNWGHGCHGSRESAEYQTANGAPFAESQDILRVHDTGPFTTLILPYRKTETPTRAVTQQTCGVQIVQGSETSCFNASAATFSNATNSILTVFDSSSQTAFGVTAAGGPQEAVVQSSQIVWTIAGFETGARSLTLPGTWYPNQALSQLGNTFSYIYSGGSQAAPVTITFSQTP